LLFVVSRLIVLYAHLLIVNDTFMAIAGFAPLSLEQTEKSSEWLQ